MADEAAKDDRAGIAQTVARVLSRLDPAFLGLLTVDAVFMLAIVYLFNAQNNSRERVLGPTLQACISSIPLTAIKELRPPGESAALQGAISDLRQQMTENREGVRDLGRQVEPLRAAIDGLRPALDTLRADLTRDTRARLQGPAR